MPDKRDAIVAAALEVIAEGGLTSFTQPRVARRADLRQSHLTYYFPTRDDLLFAVAEEAVRRRVAVLTPVPGADGPEEKLDALARVLTSPEQTRVLIALAQSADQYEPVRDSFEALARGVAPLSAALLKDFGVEVDSGSLALLQATSTGIAVLALARGADNVLPLARQLLAELLSGLAARPTVQAQPSADS